MSYVRVVRFTDVDPSRIEQLITQIEEADGPPEGIVSSGIQILHDADQGTAVVIQSFDSMDDMTTSEAVLEAMPSDMTPGTRASVDRTELKVAMTA